MSRLSLLERYNSLLYVNEEIHAHEAYTDKGALLSVIKGRRDVAVLHLTKKFIRKLEKYNLNIIPLRMLGLDAMYAIVHRNENKALQLYNIARSKGGYLSDSTPDEARQIGQLLGYFKKDIDEYIRRKYRTGSHIPLRTDKPDDYNDLYEQNFLAFEKQITKDIKGYGLDKKFIIQLGDVKVYAVNADFVRDTDPGLGFNGFTDGGSHYVTSLPGYKKWIPEDEIWIDDVFLSKPNDFGAFILHELLERHLMKYYGVSYDIAHADFAEKAEPMFRKKVKSGIGLDVIKEIYNYFVEKYARHHKIKKLNESNQFKRMTHLMRKLYTSYVAFHWFFL
jgi:hypothetical protein